MEKNEKMCCFEPIRTRTQNSRRRESSARCKNGTIILFYTSDFVSSSRKYLRKRHVVAFVGRYAFQRFPVNEEEKKTLPPHTHTSHDGVITHAAPPSTQLWSSVGHWSSRDNWQSSRVRRRTVVLFTKRWNEITLTRTLKRAGWASLHRPSFSVARGYWAAESCRNNTHALRSVTTEYVNRPCTDMKCATPLALGKCYETVWLCELVKRFYSLSPPVHFRHRRPPGGSGRGAIVIEFTSKKCSRA